MAALDVRQKSALLWGVAGAMAFLALHQAYLLLDGTFLGVGPIAVAALVVFGATTVAAYLLESRLDDGSQPPRTDAG